MKYDKPARWGWLFCAKNQGIDAKSLGNEIRKVIVLLNF